MKNLTIIIILLLALLKTQAQDYLISFAGTGESIIVDSVQVKNLTRNTSLTLSGTDILHLMDFVGIDQTIVQNNADLLIYPNPTQENSVIEFEATSSGLTTIEIYDMTGKQITQIQKLLPGGRHTFTVCGLCGGIYTLSIKSAGYFYSGKIVCTSLGPGDPSISLVSEDKKSAEKSNLKSVQDVVPMQYSNGNQLLFKCFSGIYSTVIPLVPEQSQTIIANFNECTDADGNNYTSVTIGPHTWMAENLNVGVRINGNLNQTDNGIIEKYCYDNDDANCSIYGGLYQWNEIRQYINTICIQGICPTGWHLPTNAEWCTLTQFIDPTVGCTWTHYWCGTDIGGKMKSTGTLQSGTGLWYAPNSGATNESGFTALPAGYRVNGGVIDYLGTTGSWWSATENNTDLAWSVSVYHFENKMFRGGYDKLEYGFSVRCILDYPGQVLEDHLINFEGTGDTTAVDTIIASNLKTGVTVTLDGGDTLHLVRSKGFSMMDSKDLPYTDGDQLLFKGKSGPYVTIIPDIPLSNKTITFSFFDCTDADNNHYATVTVGTQVWMAENLNVGVRINGNLDQTDNGTIEKYCYSNSINKCNAYGGLYQWNEMMQYVETQGAQGICPAGWHLPTNSQFTSLASYLGGNGNAGGRMKSTGTLEAGTGLWHDPNEEATNSSGFSAIPGGLLNSAEFFQIGYEVNWWSSNVYYGRAWYQTINYLQGFLIPNFGSKNNGYSVRCLRD